MGGWLDKIGSILDPIGSVVGGIVNGVSNIVSTHETNEANKDINESQLAAQKEYWNQQQQNWLQQRRWSLEDRAFENAYNSPIAQKARYIAAGLNPYLAMQGQSAVGSVQANQPNGPQAPTVPQAHPMIAPDLSGFGFGIEKAARLHLDSRLAETDMAAIHTRMQNETAKTIAEIERMGVQNAETRQIIDNMKLDWKFNDESYNSRMDQLKYAVEGARLDNERRQIDNDIADYQRSMSKTQQANLQRKLDAEWSEIMSRIHANNASAARDMALKILTDLQSEGQEFDNDLKFDMADAIVDKAYNEADYEYWKSMREAKHVRLGSYLGDNTPDPAQATSGGSEYTNWRKRGNGQRRISRQAKKRRSVKYFKP